MQTIKFVLLVILVTTVSIGTAKDAEKEHWQWGPCHFDDHISIEFEHGDLLVFDNHTDELLFEITHDYELYVMEKHIETDEDEKDLLKEYYSTTEKMLDEAKKLGYKGAKVGLQGARIAVEAVGGVFEIVFSGFDEGVIDHFEDEIEKEAEKIELQAEQLEEEAEIIEDLADELDDIYNNLAQAIPELEELEIEHDD